ncbi:hypothetical protein P4V43_26885 [Brevibacillus fortis]|uniref:hypothetical protein n=1 Tax=Brevibacillus fortis TaxID=2126352 RepID=UPI002E2050B5|nr:hypothetical protein [Brevibacillus fortis]
MSDNPKVYVTAYSEYLVMEFHNANVGDVFTITITADDGKGGIVSTDWIITVTTFEP